MRARVRLDRAPTLLSDESHGAPSCRLVRGFLGSSVVAHTADSHQPRDPRRGRFLMPNRMLREAICTSEDINALSDAEEAFFYRLLVQCDDHGRCDARSAVLRSRCYPLRLSKVSERKIERMLGRLREVGILNLYEVRGQPYLEIPSWGEHQRLRQTRGKFPAPTGEVPQPAGHGGKLRQVAADSGGSRPELELEVEVEGEPEAEERTKDASAPVENPFAPTPDQMYLLQRLWQDKRWEKVTPGAVVKLNTAIGTRFVTAALQDVRLQEPDIRTSAYALLETIAKEYAKGAA